MSLSNSRLQAVILNASLESMPTDGKARVEREMEFYGRIVDFSQLSKADSKETQEQWEIRPPLDETLKYGGGIRVRCINGDKYVMTVKAFEKGSKQGRLESEIEVSKDMFELFKRLSTGGMVKTRHVFKIDDQHSWEVDVYTGENGEPEAWCKVDLELFSKDFQVPALPIQLEEVISSQYGERTDEEIAKIKELMDTVFIRKNQFPATPAA